MKNYTKSISYSRLIAGILSVAFLAQPIFVIAQVTGPIETLNSVGYGEGYQWRWNTDDYLKPPHTWTDCPSGYALAGASVQEFGGAKDKTIGHINCKRIDGLTSEVIVKELNHFTQTDHQAMGDVNCSKSLEEMSEAEAVYCLVKLPNIIPCAAFGGIKISQVDCPAQGEQFSQYEGSALNGCPRNWIITGVLKRRDSKNNKNITAIKCQRLRGGMGEAVPVGIQDNVMSECPANTAASGILTINHSIYKDKTNVAKLIYDNVKFWNDSTKFLELGLYKLGVPEYIDLSWLLPYANYNSVAIAPTFTSIYPMTAPEIVQIPVGWGDTIIHYAYPYVSAAPLVGFALKMIVDYLLPEILDGGDDRNWTERALLCSGLPKNMGDTIAPTVRIVEPTNGSSWATTNDSVQLTATAVDDRGYGNIFYPFAWVSQELKAAGQMQCIYGYCRSNVPLVPGRNEITVFARDKIENVGRSTIVINKQVAISTPTLTIDPSAPVQPGSKITLNISGAAANSLVETRLSNRGRTAWYAWSPQGNTDASGNGSVGPLDIPPNVALGTYYAQARVVGIESPQVSYTIARLDDPGGGPSCRVSVGAQTGTKRALNITFSGTALPNGFGVGAWKEPCSPVVGSPSTCVNTARWDNQISGSGNNRTVTIDATKYSSAYSGNIYGNYKANVYIWGSNPSGSDNVLCASNVAFSINRPTAVSDSKTNLAETLQGLRAALKSLREVLENARR